jgi:hypothetical protein
MIFNPSNYIFVTFPHSSPNAELLIDDRCTPNAKGCQKSKSSARVRRLSKHESKWGTQAADASCTSTSVASPCQERIPSVDHFFHRRSYSYSRRQLLLLFLRRSACVRMHWDEDDGWMDALVSSRDPNSNLKNISIYPCALLVHSSQ